MTPEEYRKQKDREFRANRRSQGESLILKSMKQRERMAKYTSSAIAKRHGVTHETVRNMRNGRDPKRVAEEVKAAVRKDIKISERLNDEYLRWEDIAELLNVSRALVRQWAKEMGATSPAQSMVKKVRARVEPIKEDIVIEGKAVEFLTMPTVVSCPAAGFYY